MAKSNAPPDAKSHKDYLPESILTRLAGSPAPILPGESADEYRRGLVETIKELNAKTHLQVYFAEKIFDCLWVIRRFEDQQRHIVLNRIIEKLANYTRDKNALRTLIENQQWDDRGLRSVLEAASQSMQGIVAEATKWENGTLRLIETQIADRTKTLKGFQVAYEALVNRKIMIERITLQNELIKRDLAAIDMAAPTQQVRNASKAIRHDSSDHANDTEPQEVSGESA